ncbi:MAG TPA: hypothetical protein VKH19_20170 [Gemmatimonadaceae bacterium]|nr:hypothetical protein [Gemmatimonadaceae bacterium]
MHARRCASPLIAALTVLAIGGRLEAQGTGDVVTRCQVDARTALSQARARVDTIWFGEAPRVASGFNTGVQVAGAGIVHDLATRQWRRFLYSCAWMPSTFQTGVSIRIDSAAFHR